MVQIVILLGIMGTYSAFGSCEQESPDLVQIFGISLRDYVPQRVFYMDGDALPSSSNDGSVAAPFRNFTELENHLWFQSGSRTVPAGTLVYVSNTVQNTSHASVRFAGTALDPVIVRKKPGAAHAVIRGSPSAWYPAIKIVGTYVVFKGIHFKDGGSHVVHIDGGNVQGHTTETTGVAFLKCKMENGRNAVLKASQMRELFVRSSEFRNAGAFEHGNILSQQAVDLVGVVRFWFEGNIVENAPHSLFVAKGGSRDGIITKNIFQNQETYPENQFQFRTEEPAVVLGGATHPSPGNPVSVFFPPDTEFEAIKLLFGFNVIRNVASFIAFRGCSKCTAVRNTMWNSPNHFPQTQLVRFLPGEQGLNYGQPSINRGNRFQSNIVVGAVPELGYTTLFQCDNASTQPSAERAFGPIGDHNTVSYNLFYSRNSNPGWDWYCSSIHQNEEGNIFGQNPQLSHLIPQRLDLTRDQGVPAFDHIPLGDFLTHDLSNQCVDQSRFQDLGALEL